MANSDAVVLTQFLLHYEVADTWHSFFLLELDSIFVVGIISLTNLITAIHNWWTFAVGLYE